MIQSHNFVIVFKNNMAVNTNDRTPDNTIIKRTWVEKLFLDDGYNKCYDRIRKVKKHLIEKHGEKSPGIKNRKPTLKEFCEYYGLDIATTSQFINARFNLRINYDYYKPQTNE